jgi:glutaredoxin
MEITAYTLPGCGHCNSLKELFKRADVDYVEIKLKKDITVETFNKSFPDIQQFPFVVIDDEQVGGLMETVKMFVSRGLVTSKKKE